MWILKPRMPLVNEQTPIDGSHCLGAVKIDILSARDVVLSGAMLELLLGRELGAHKFIDRKSLHAVETSHWDGSGLRLWHSNDVLTDFAGDADRFVHCFKFVFG